MRRTRRRPMVREQVSKRAAYTFGVVLGIISTLMLGLGANWLAAALSVTAILYYVFIYTVWLKRRTAQNIVWGGVAGCFPPLIGWTLGDAGAGAASAARADQSTCASCTARAALASK